EIEEALDDHDRLAPRLKRRARPDLGELVGEQREREHHAEEQVFLLVPFHSREPYQPFPMAARQRAHSGASDCHFQHRSHLLPLACSTLGPSPMSARCFDSITSASLKRLTLETMKKSASHSSVNPCRSMKLLVPLRGRR